MNRHFTKKILFAAVGLALSASVLFAQNTKKLSLEKSSNTSGTDTPRIELSKNQICNVYALDYSPDGKHLVAGYNNGSVRIWDITTGKMERELKGHTGVVWSVAYSPSGKTIISGSADKTIKCWNAENGNLIRTLPNKKGDEGHSSIVSYVTFNPSGTYIASGSSDKSVKFWDASTGQLLQTLSNTHSKTIAAISYSKTGRYVATASWDNTAKIYHAMGGIKRNLLEGHKDAVFAVQFSPDEKYIATGSSDKTVRIYEVESGKFLHSITGITGEVWTLSYTPDGKDLVIGASDGSVVLFDAATGKMKTKYSGHEHEVRSCAFDKQGKHLFTGDSGGIIKMWDVEKGELLVTMLQITDGNWVTWTPEGFLTGSDGALSELSYTFNNIKYSLGEIQATVYRPDIVAAKIQNAELPDYSEQDTLAALVARDYEPDIQFEVVNADGSKRTDNTKRDINVNMKIKDTGSGIGNVYIKLNGRAFVASEGIASTKGKTHNLSSKTPLSLRKGKNTLSISVFDSVNKKEHQSAQVELEWNGNVQKSRLFVLAAGIDNYTDKTITNLAGCVNDAKEIAEVSRNYAGDLYMNVFEKVLVDGAVTRKNFLSVIKDFGSSVQPDDVFILYISGHGIVHTDGEYYFIPCDFKNDGLNPLESTAVSKWDIINALSTVKAENITVILDTCNSASFGSKQPSEDELMLMSKQAIIERMGALSGLDLIAACTSTQVAIDNFNGHGIFTYCLLDGIKGFADLDQNGQITSAELATYVIKEIPIESNKKYGYKQEPQRSQPKFDFPMFGKLNPLEGQSLKEALEIAKLIRENGLNLEAATTQVQITYVATDSIIEDSEQPQTAKSDSTANVVLQSDTQNRIDYNYVKQNYDAIEKAAEKGNAEAQYAMGIYYIKEYNLKIAINWLQKAARQGNAKAQYELGELSRIKQNYREAKKWYEKAAKQEYADAQFSLGSLYRDGNGVQQNYNEAIKWFKKAVEQGNSKAQYVLGILYYNGEGVEKNYNEAKLFFEMAALQDNSYAQTKLGEMYYYGYGVKQNYEEARKWFVKAVERTSARDKTDALYGLGMIYRYVDLNLWKAREWFEKAAERGNTNAQFELGELYYYEYGEMLDYEEARKWYEIAAGQGNNDAQYKLGLLYFNGDGVEKNYNEARKWFEKAAEKGHDNAQFKLGLIFYNGYGVAINYTKAKIWWEKSAIQGNIHAQNNLGVLYDHGEGVTQNHAEANKWYAKAAEQDDPLALSNLGYNYLCGLGVKQDYIEARKCFEKATKNYTFENISIALYGLGEIYYYGYGVNQDYEKSREYYQEAADRGDEDAKKALQRLNSITENNVNNAWPFPLFEMELGKSTLNDLKKLGGKQKEELSCYTFSRDDSPYFSFNENSVLCDVFVYFEPWPKELSNKGYNPNSTYTQLKSFLISQGYEISSKYADQELVGKSNTPIPHQIIVGFTDDKLNNIIFATLDSPFYRE